MMSCTTAQQAVAAYTKHPSALTMPLFIALRKIDTVCCSPFEGIVGGLWRGGWGVGVPFHNFSLVHEAVG